MTDDVGQWLEALGLSRYVDNFAENEIGMELLADLADDDLK